MSSPTMTNYTKRLKMSINFCRPDLIRYSSRYKTNFYIVFIINIKEILLGKYYFKITISTDKKKKQ